MSYSHSVAEIVAAPASLIYSIVSDVTRTGEWSPTCQGGEWEDPTQTGVGATFVGHNQTATRTWTTTSTVVVAEPGKEFAWEVGNGFVRWSYVLHELGDGRTELRHYWTFTDAGLAFFNDKYGAEAEEEISIRTESAYNDMPRTLFRIRAIAEGEAHES